MVDPPLAPRQRLSGAQIIVEYLVRQGVPYAAGIPGHGAWTLTDALLDRTDAVRTVQVMHEQSAAHLADGYYRASGRPLLAFTSIGPGATNTVVGMATAYVDSTAVALMTGSTHTYMRGHGVLQEIERRHVADNPRIFEPVVKEWWQPSRVDELPFVLHRAWNQMLSGRPGPILLDVPMDVQADSADVRLPDPERASLWQKHRLAWYRSSGTTRIWPITRRASRQSRCSTKSRGSVMPGRSWASGFPPGRHSPRRSNGGGFASRRSTPRSRGTRAVLRVTRSTSAVSGLPTFTRQAARSWWWRSTRLPSVMP